MSNIKPWHQGPRASARTTRNLAIRPSPPRRASEIVQALICVFTCALSATTRPVIALITHLWLFCGAIFKSSGGTPGLMIPVEEERVWVFPRSRLSRLAQEWNKNGLKMVLKMKSQRVGENVQIKNVDSIGDEPGRFTICTRILQQRNKDGGSPF